MLKSKILSHLQEQVGKEISVSDWIAITQDRIDAFAECTEDKHWIHVDQKLASKGPFKTTVAHGFLILSLIPHLIMESQALPEGVRMAANYGLNKVRFVKPVKKGARIRNRSVLQALIPKGRKKILLVLENTVEIDKEKKPAMVAESLVMLFI